jgi:hypothetical protein
MKTMRKRTEETVGGELYRKINEKMGETTSLPIESLVASEMNTRSCCIDKQHVEYLAGKIRERGFHPKRAISVNIITGVGGNAICCRVAAGVHRLEAAKAAGLTEIPALVYRNLTEDEECLLDKWDNEMDEDHKPLHFLEEAEHYKYLAEVKSWSQRQIARNSGANKGIVFYRLQIANIPEEAKAIIRGVPTMVGTFQERYFRDICKLSEPHIIAICHEIDLRGEQAARGERDGKGHPVHPMKQAEIKTRVQELLDMEKSGKALKRKLRPIPTQAELFPEELEPEEERYEAHTVVVDFQREEAPPVEPAPAATAEPIPQLSPELAHRSPQKSTQKMNFDRCVRWFKFLGLLREKGTAFHIVLKKLIEYDIWYRGNEDEPFYFSEKEYEDPLALFAEEAGVERDHILKRTLPALKNEKLIDYWIEDGRYRFKPNWDALFEMYCRRAYAVPYKEDGLKDLPTNFTGVIRPTPFHYVRIVNGKVLPWNGGKVETADAAPARLVESVPRVGQLPQACGDSRDPLQRSLRELKPPMGEKEILFCLGKRNETETALKLLREMASEKRGRIENEAAYVLELVRRGPQAPQGFVTPQEARELEEQVKQRRAFFRAFRELKPTHFVRDGKEYEILSIDGEEGFVIERACGPHLARFDKWMDMKHFRRAEES